MNRLQIRLIVAAALIVLVAAGVQLAGGAAKPAHVHMPAVDFRLMPMELGPWRGERVELDPRIFNAIGAKVVEDRRFTNPQGALITFHGAVFDDPEEGVYHTPTNCYRASGWTRRSEIEVPLEVAGARTVPVLLSVWQRQNAGVTERIFVLNWYELGDYYNIKGRWTMGVVRWKMRNVDPWPALSKVLMQTAIGEDEEAARRNILDLAARVSLWMEENMRQTAAPGAPASPPSIPAAAPGAPAPPPADGATATDTHDTADSKAAP